MELKQKHIAVICNYELLEDRVGGMDYFYWAFNKTCMEEGIKIDWFFPNIAKHGNYHEFKIIPAYDLSIEASVIKHLETNTVQYTTIITHFVELCTSFFASLRNYQKAKVIAVDHNPRPIQGYPLKKRLKKRIKGLLYSKYIDVFVGVSEHTSQAVLKDFGTFLKPKVQTVFNGVLIDDILPKTTPKDITNPKFLVASHLRYSKGIQDLIQAVNLLSDDLKHHLKIDVYGDGPYKEALLTLVNTYNLQEVFSFKGSSSRLNEIYKDYDYLIHPSYEETFCYAVIEALAANVIPITTHEGGNVLNILKGDENSMLFKAKNSQALSLILTDILKGKRTITKNTRTWIADKFSIGTMVHNHLKLLEY